jgi:methyl-accepting chemotaxis protein
MNIFANISISKKLILLLTIFIIGYTAFGSVSFKTLEDLRVKGNLYNQIVMSKDLIADVLPPPGYIIEAYLDVLQVVDETDPAQRDYFFKELKQLQTNYEERHQFWRNEPLLEQGAMREAMLKGAYEPATRFFDIVFSKFIPALKSGNREFARELVHGDLKTLYETHRKSVDQVVLGATEKYEKIESLANTKVQEDAKLLYTIAIAVIVAAIILSLVIRHSIVKPIIKVTDTLKDISEAEGDLTRTIAINSKDEVGHLALYFNKTLEKIRKLIITVKNQTESLVSISGELSSLSGQIALAAEGSVSKGTMVASATEQTATNINSIASSAEETSVCAVEVANEVEQLSSNISTMASTAEETSVNANDVAGAAEQMSVNMSTIASAIEEMSASISQISSNASEAGKVANEATVKSHNATNVMNKLGIAAKEIGQVTDVIKKIADKTNLLALNATIEAASAGVAGKGFAVVAGEIKELANQSALSANDIARRIESIQAGTNEAVTVIGEVSNIITTINHSMESISASVIEQTKASNEIASNVAEANTGAKRVASAIGEVASGSKDIARNASKANMSVEHVYKSINEVTKSSKDIARNAEEAAKGASMASQGVSSITQDAKNGAEGAKQTNHQADGLAAIANDLQHVLSQFKA